ncbi:hypothetical protein CRUP_038374, partial [Coryphaenoides rupestris]
MELGDNSWSMVKREVSSSSPGSPAAEHGYLPGGEGGRGGGGGRGDTASEELRSPAPPTPSELDAALGHRRSSSSSSLHSYVHFGHHHHHHHLHHHHANSLAASSSSPEDLPLFTDLDQAGNKLVKAGLLVDPADMYQTLAIAAAQSQTGYDAPSNGYMHSNPHSPVYVPGSRVPGSMIPSLPYLQPGGGGGLGSSGQSSGHGVASHAVWSQSAPESPSYTAGSPHASSRFHYNSPSPPNIMSNTGR